MENKRRGYNNHQKNSFFNNKKRKVQSLEPGASGFLCTCNFQEKNCVREAYNLLNEYANKLYGAEKTPPEEEDVEEDVSDALQKQIADIQSETTKTRRFQSLATGATNCVFIQAQVEDPVHLAHAIMEDVAQTKVQRTRFLLRLIPVEAVCTIKLNDITETAYKLFDKHFAGEPTTFCIVFNKRLNNSPRDIVIKELADVVAAKNPEHKVDLQNPKLSVVVEMIKGICLMSVVPDYYKYKKYNLFELCAQKEKSDAAPDTAVPEEPVESVENIEDVK